MSSLYQFLVRSRRYEEVDTFRDFRDFLLQRKAGTTWIERLHSTYSQLDFFTLENQLKLEFVGHFEYFDDDLHSVTTKLGAPLSLNHVNRSANSLSDYRRRYDDEMI